MLRRSLYGVVSDGRVLGLFVPLPKAALTGFPQGASISFEAGFGLIVFLSAVFVVFLSWYQRTLIIHWLYGPGKDQALRPRNKV